MLSVNEAVQRGVAPRVLAEAVLTEYFDGKQVTYPINPFQMLTDFGVPFVFRPFSKYEGVYVPAENVADSPVVGINIKRPITRQRFTAAHELCHHIKDCNSGSICAINSSNPIEKYAENFAAELLMPVDELKKQVSHYAGKGAVTLDNVLCISEYFGVSFQACLNRVAFVLKRIEGTADTLKKEATKYKPDKKREALGFSYLPLYEQLINAAELNLVLQPSEFIKTKFCTDYIYNDSRLEGVELDIENVAEIVTDIRLHGAKSPFCTEENKDIIEVAGHANMYAYVFDKGLGQKLNVYSINLLHQMLFSCAPEPDFGGKFRTSNPLVVGAKFETIDYAEVPSEMAKLYNEVDDITKNKNTMPLSVYIERVIALHHRLTVIHPFGDGNGRSSRGFLNLFLLQRGIVPVYIKVQEKTAYLDALREADLNSDYRDLFIHFFRAILQMQAELTRRPLL